MRFASLALLTSLISPVFAQQVDWLISSQVDYTLNPDLPDQALASAPGRLIGMRQTSITFIYGQRGYGEAMMEAIDPLSGAQEWSCALFDSVHVAAAAVDVNGMAYFAGSFMGTIGFCDGSILTGVTGQPAFFENQFIAAVDLTTGLIAWTRNVSMVEPDAGNIASLALDPQGNLWYALSGWGLAMVVRVDALGNDAETRIIDGSRIIGTISFDPWGGLYVSGAADNNGFAFGGQAYQDYGDTGYSMFVLRYRPDGTAGFVEFADDITFQNPTVVATTDGHAYLAGDLFIPTTWGDIEFNGPNWVNSVFIAKLDSSGQFLWGAESAPSGGPITGDMSRSKGPCVAVDAADNPYLFGNLRGMVDWGNGVVSDGLTLGARTMTIVSFSSDGIAQWAAASTPTGFFHNAQTITAMAEEDAIHFSGQLQGQFMFPPLTAGANGIQSAMVGRIGGLSTSVREATDTSGIAVWPNPVSDALNVEVNGAHPQRVHLFNSAGQRVRSLTLRTGHNAIGLHGLAPGLYLLRTAEGETVRVAVE